MTSKEKLSALIDATQAGEKTYPRSGNVKGYSNNEVKTRKKARSALFERGKKVLTTEDSVETLSKITTHLRELATFSKYPNEERAHARTLLYRLAIQSGGNDTAESAIAALIEAFEEEENRARAIKLVEAYESILEEAIEGFKLATKAGENTYKSGNVKGYASGQAETRKDARAKLVELGRFAELGGIDDGETLADVAAHLRELATFLKYPDGERDHARTLLYKLATETENEKVAQGAITALRFDFGDQRNRDRAIKLVEAYESILEEAIEGFKSATKAGENTYKSGNVKGYNSRQTETRRGARAKLVELGRFAELGDTSFVLV